MTGMETTFGDWLSQQLRRREMTQSELAAKLETRASTVGNWIHDRRIPGVESCWALADALDLSPVTVMRKAGHPVDEDDERSDEEDRLVAVWRKLTPEGQITAIDFVEFLRGKERQNA